MRHSPAAVALSALGVLLAPGVHADDALEVRADELVARGLDGDGSRVLVEASGHVVVQAGSLSLRAPALTLDRPAGRATLSGGVTGGSGVLVLAAQGVELGLADQSLRLVDGELTLRTGVTADQLARTLASDSPAAARALGRAALTLRATGLSRLDGPGFAASDVWLSTCDCTGDRTPLLAVSAERVEVVPGEYARVHWWKLRLFDLPVTPPLPVLTLPLAARATGLLFPVVGVNGPGGFTVEVPVFVTLGDSADLTLRTRWREGRTVTSRADPQAVRGWGEELELRWRPSVEAIGSARLEVVNDAIHTYTLRSDGRFDTGPERGPRAFLHLAHASPLAGGRVAVEASVASDGTVLYDTDGTFATAQLPYLRSVGAFSRAFAGGAAGLSTSALQVLDTRRAGPWSSGTQAALAPVARAFVQGGTTRGALALDGAGSAALELPVLGSVVGADRTPRVATHLSAGQTVALAGGRYGTLALEAGERADGLVPLSGEPVARLGAFAGLAAATRLARTFDGGWEHVVAPSLRLRAFGSLLSPYAAGLFVAGAPQDELDAALPASAGVQLVTRLATRLSHDGADRLSIFVEHHLGLDAGALDPGQLQLGLSATFGSARGAPQLAASSTLDARDASLIAASARLSGALAAGSWTAGAALDDGARSDRLATGLDLLFTPGMLLPTRATTGRLLTAEGALSMPLLDELRTQVSGGWSRRETPSEVRSGTFFTASLIWSPGGCANVGLNARFAPQASGTNWDAVQLGFTFEMGDFAAATSRAAATSAQ